MNPEYPAGAAERWMLKKRQQAYREAWINAGDLVVKKVKTPMRIAHIRKISKVRQQKFDNPTEREARKRSDWHRFEAAIAEENNQLEIQEEVLEFLPRHNIPKGANVLGSMYVLQIKRNPDGTIDKYKARLVAFGNQQKEGSFDQVKSGTARTAAVKLLLSIQAKTKAHSMVLDVKGAYLKSKVDESKREMLFLRLPDGRLAKLKKYLYGLKQAGYEWQTNLTGTLEDAGYEKSAADPLVFSKWKEGQFIIMCIDVDDFYVISDSIILLDKLHRMLNKAYGEVTIKTGDMLAYLGMQVEVSSNNSVKLSQPGYIDKLLTLVKFHENKLKIAKTPMNNSEHVPRPDDNEPVPTEFYLSLIGALNYLAQFTRPDIMYALSRCAQKCKKPTKKDLRQVVRIFCYIAGTRDYGLSFTHGSVVLWGHADSSHNSYNDAKGHLGYCFSLGEHDGSFYCKSAKIKLTTLSSTESEYVALCEAARDAVWLRRLLRDIGFPQSSPTVMFEVNKSCIDMVHGMSNHKASKHINPKFHFTCDQVRKGKLVIRHKDTEIMVADLLTKPLGKASHDRLSKLMLNIP
jgi:hypothetical protein